MGRRKDNERETHIVMKREGKKGLNPSGKNGSPSLRAPEIRPLSPNIGK
jgi:hypothetical protein